jgi:hypothetical protein
MNDIPTSGPIPIKSSHQERDAINSRHSFSSNQRNGDLGESKKHLFQITPVRLRHCGQLRNRALATYLPAVQKDEAVAEARGIANLMDGEKQGSPPRGMSAERGRDVPSLTKIETFEWLVDQQRWLRGQQPDRQQRALSLPF